MHVCVYIYKIHAHTHACVYISTVRGRNTERQHHRYPDLSWMNAREGIRQPRATQSDTPRLTHHPHSQGTELRLTKRLEFFTTTRYPSPSRLRHLMPIPSSCPSAPFSSPHHLLPARSLSPQLGFFLCSSPKASLLPFSLSFPPSLLSCRLSLGKGGGELGEHGEEPGEGSRAGERGESSQPPLTDADKEAPPPLALLSPPLPPPSKSCAQKWQRLSFFTPKINPGDVI